MRIMFVCHGNICRSPMAEFIFKALLEERGIAEGFYVASSATSDEEIYRGVGNPIYPPARRELAAHGIFPPDKRAVRLSADDLERYDMFVVMDGRNLTGARSILGDDSKIYKLMDFTTRGGDVADPWYTDRFDIAYHDIYDGCVALKTQGFAPQRV